MSDTELEQIPQEKPIRKKRTLTEEQKKVLCERLEKARILSAQKRKEDVEKNQKSRKLESLNKKTNKFVEKEKEILGDEYDEAEAEVKIKPEDSNKKAPSKKKKYCKLVFYEKPEKDFKLRFGDKKNKNKPVIQPIYESEEEDEVSSEEDEPDDRLDRSRHTENIKQESKTDYIKQLNEIYFD